MTLSRDERGPDGLLTPTAMALDALVDNGCDCGVDEPGTCLACRCEAAIRHERAERDAARAEVERLRATTTWHPVTATEPGPGLWVVTDRVDVWLGERLPAGWDGSYMAPTQYLPLVLPAPPEVEVLALACCEE